MYNQAKLNVIDNSGAAKVTLINAFKLKKYKKINNIGKYVKVVVSILDKKKKKRIERKEVTNALFIKTRKKYFSLYCYKKYQKNGVILLNAQYKPIGTRNFGLFDATKIFSIKNLSLNIVSNRRI